MLFLLYVSMVVKCSYLCFSVVYHLIEKGDLCNPKYFVYTLNSIRTQVEDLVPIKSV